jgi:outer membrane protein assembly factor BamB
LVTLAVTASPAWAQWPQWGGPNRDFKVEATGLANEWPSDGPRTIWHRTLGTGYSAVVADAGVLYTMYRTKKTDAHEYTIALDAKTGETLWQERDLAAVPASLPEHQRTEFTGPNATPLVVGDRLFTVGRNALLNCRKRSDGTIIWKHDLVGEFGAEIPNCGFSASPLAYKDTIVLPVGRAEGDEREGYSLIAFDQESGAIVWHQHTFRIGHSSPILITFGGQDQLVLCTVSALIGVDPATGALLWEYSPPGEAQFQMVRATPVWDGKDTLVLSEWETGYAIRLTKNAGTTSAELLWTTRKAPLDMGTPILTDELLIGSRAGMNGPLVGQDPLTGKRLWLERAFQTTVLVAGGDKLIMLDSKGQLGLATATRQGLTIHSRCQLTTQYSFTAPTLVGTTLFVRDERHIMALDLSHASTGDTARAAKETPSGAKEQTG